MPIPSYETTSFIDQRETALNQRYPHANADYRAALLEDLAELDPQVKRWAEGRISRPDASPNMLTQQKMLEVAVIVGETMSGLKDLPLTEIPIPITREKAYRIPPERRITYRQKGSVIAQSSGLNRLSRVS